MLSMARADMVRMSMELEYRCGKLPGGRFAVKLGGRKGMLRDALDTGQKVVSECQL